MPPLGEFSWIVALRTPNADVARFNAVLDLHNLRVATKLDALADAWLAADGGPRSVLLIAHAGDGKTEFLRRLISLAPSSSIKTFDHETTAPTWSTGGRWLLNDPSQLPTSRVIEFLTHAFSPAAPGDARFVAGINRGLLRAIVQLDACEGCDAMAWAAAKQWLLSALAYGAPGVDDGGRIAVPLDLRVLVPGPGDHDSSAQKVALAVLSNVRDQAGASWTPTVWAERIARVLALVEASGHHVTFREVLALSGAVAEALLSGHLHEPLAVLFMASSSAFSPSLKPLEMVLRRLDPAKVPNLAIDLDPDDALTRDARVRESALGNLAAAFGNVGVAQGLPYRHAGVFLRVCRHVTGSAVVEVAEARRSVFRGLSRIAWGAHGKADDLDVLPLTSPVHPGATAGGTRVLRAALSIESADFVPDVAAPGGRYVEHGLTLPALVMRRDSKDTSTPRLRLDLELFEMLARVGAEEHATVARLGPRAAQVLAWFDALVAHWADHLAVVSSSGLVAFQTFLGAQRPVALRPSPEGRSAQIVTPVAPEPNVLAVLQRAIALDDKVMITPSACASALLQWAGYTPLLPGGDIELDAIEREALGASSVPRVSRYRRLVWPAFPWSSHTLGVAVAANSTVLTKGSAWEKFAPDLGAACAKVLGFTDGDPEAWRRALRSAWADDEECFDTHPSGRLVHQRLAVGVSGRQLPHELPASLPAVSDVRRGVSADLLAAGDTLPFSRPSRWWQLGTWASWWLMLEGLRAAHGLSSTPVLLPYVSDADGALEYQLVRGAWFHPPTKIEPLVAVQVLAQGAGWCTPPSATKNFDLHLDGPMLDLIRLVAWRVHREGEGRPDRRSLARLQDALLEAGLFARPSGRSVKGRIPGGALPFLSPDSGAFDAALRAALQRLAMLDVASDGATLFHAPWGDGAVR
jgi:hypothetical protein